MSSCRTPGYRRGRRGHAPLLVLLVSAGGCSGHSAAPPGTPCPASGTPLSDCFTTSGIVQLPFRNPENAGAAAVADVDGDGRPDVYYFNNADDGRLYRNLGDFAFEELDGSSGLPEHLAAGAFGDLDNDGDSDLVAIRTGDDPGFDLRFLRADGHGHFSDDTDDAGFDLEGGPGIGRAAAVHLTDLDLDGRLDVIVTPHEHSNGQPALWLSAGGDTWSRQAALPFLSPFGWCHALYPADYDGDGRPDLMVLTDDGYEKEAPPRLYLRSELPALRFREMTITGLFGDHAPASPMGASAFDLDGDGRLEYALSEDGASTILHLVWGGRDRALELGLGRSPVAPMGMRQTTWSPAFVDLDGDGAPELFANSHSLDGPSVDTWAVLWRWDGARFVDASNLLPDAGTHPEQGLAVADFDGDGRDDLFVGGYGAPPRLLRNRVPTAGATLTVRLRGGRARGPSGCNADGFGAVVTVEAEGARSQSRLYYPGGATLGWSEPRARFGLGAAAGARRVLVDWRPCGGTRVQEVKDVPAGTVIIDESP